MIVLLGYMGSGKTYISHYMSKKYNLTHCDLDQYIEEKENKTIPQIFKDRSEIYFRKIEHEYLSQLLKNENVDLLSLGGGTPCYADNMQLLKMHHVKSIYLKVDVIELTDRLFSDKSERPLLQQIKDKIQLKDFIRKHLFEREHYYRQAKYVINVTNLSPDDISQKILELS